MDLEPVLRILAAAGLSLPIGMDREVRGHAAGVRTHLVLASATAALGFLSVDLAEGNAAADPTRIASYTVAGIGFLGAGLIIGVRGRVLGLTTAVGAFAVMAIGVLCGTGYVAVGLVLAVLTLVTLAPLDWIGARTYGRWTNVEAAIHLTVDDATHLVQVLELPGSHDVEVRNVDLREACGVALVVLVVRGRRDRIAALREALHAEEAVVGRALVTGDGSESD
jgi:putative Mg2+ transporter-C (MgtC) family protein